MQGQERLADAGLTLWDAIAQSVGFMGPVLSLALISGLVASGAGGATPLAMLLAAAGMLALGWVIAQFATRIAKAGSLYDYVTDAFGPRVGFIAGWIYYGGVLCLAIAIIVVIGGITADSFGLKIPWLILDFVYAALVFAALYLGIKISTRLQLVLVAVSVTSILIFCLDIIIRGGAAGNTLAAFSPSSVGKGAGLFLGLLFAILIFVGFESAANLGEETADPKRNIPLAVLLSLIVIGAYQVLGTYAIDIGYGIANASKWAADPAVFITLGNQYANGAVANFLQVVVILDIAAVGLATAVAATHGIFAMARDRRIPGALAKVDSTRGTPIGAIVFYIVAGLGIATITALGGGIFPLNGLPTYLPMFIQLAGIGSLALVIVYVMVCVGGLKALRGHTNMGLLWLAGIVGAVVCFGAFYGAIFPSGALGAFPPYPGTVPPIFIAIWAVVGIILAVVRGAQMTQEAPSPG